MKTETNNNGQKQTAAQRRRAALVARLAFVKHWLWGNLAVTPVPGTVFNPRAFFLDPQRLADCLTYWGNRARRDSCGAGLPQRLRDAACEQAAQACLTYLMDADYKRLGVTGDEFARAILIAYKRCRRAFWRDVDAHRDAMRETRAKAKGWRPWNRAQNSRTPDPRRIVHAADALGMDATAVDGRGMCDEAPGALVTIPGGPSGRGETDGRMACVTIRDRAVNVPCLRWDADARAFVPDTLELSEIETAWRMIRGRGRAQQLPACTVREGVPMPRPTFTPAPLPTAGVPQPEGLTNGRRPRQPLPTVTAADALHNLRRMARGMDAPADRQRMARAIRAHRAAVRAN